MFCIIVPKPIVQVNPLARRGTHVPPLQYENVYQPPADAYELVNVNPYPPSKEYPPPLAESEVELSVLHSTVAVDVAPSDIMDEPQGHPSVVVDIYPSESYPTLHPSGLDGIVPSGWPGFTYTTGTDGSSYIVYPTATGTGTGTAPWPIYTDIPSIVYPPPISYITQDASTYTTIVDSITSSEYSTITHPAASQIVITVVQPPVTVTQSSPPVTVTSVVTASGPAHPIVPGPAITTTGVIPNPIGPGYPEITATQTFYNSPGDINIPGLGNCGPAVTVTVSECPAGPTAHVIPSGDMSMIDPGTPSATEDAGTVEPTRSPSDPNTFIDENGTPVYVVDPIIHEDEGDISMMHTGTTAATDDAGMVEPTSSPSNPNTFIDESNGTPVYFVDPIMLEDDVDSYLVENIEG